jgi:hypothetical protein
MPLENQAVKYESHLDGKELRVDAIDGSARKIESPKPGIAFLRK